MIAEETAEDDAIEGTQTIDLQEGSPNGVLLLHGFGDTPQTLGLLARHLRASVVAAALSLKRSIASSRRALQSWKTRRAASLRAE